jgi:hypothetical protein
MSPVAVLMFLGTLLLAGFSLAAFGFTINTTGPPALYVLGAGWQLWMEWLRHRSALRHRHTGFMPGTQHLALMGTLGFGVCMTAGFVWLILAADSFRR